MDNSALFIPRFGKICPQDAVCFIQQMLEYCMLHDSMKKTVQESPADYSAMGQNEALSKAMSFIAERTRNDCSIITDFMLNRCRELMKKTE